MKTKYLKVILPLLIHKAWQNIFVFFIKVQKLYQTKFMSCYSILLSRMF